MAKYLQALAQGFDNSVPAQTEEQHQAKERGKKLLECADILLFRDYFTVDQVRLHAGYFCHQSLICPSCAIRRSAKMLRRYVERAMHLLDRDRELKACLVTLTVKNREQFLPVFNHLVRSFERLFERRKQCINNSKAWTEAANMRAGVHSIEVKRGKGMGLWHPHTHGVWLCHQIPDQEQLQAEWREITGDSHQVDVRLMNCYKHGIQPTEEALTDDMVEVFKYSLKFSEMTVQDNWAAARELAGKRLIRSYGEFRGLSEIDNLLDDPLDEKDLPYVEIICKYNRDLKQYIPRTDGEGR